MKNKTKKQKIKKQAVSVPEGPRYWFYMSPESTGVRAIHDCLKEMDAVQTEIWEEAGVLEVILPDGHSMDIETGRPDLKDEYSKRFLEEHQVKSLFYVTVVPESLKDAKDVMGYVAEKLGGFFCGDTEDFSPLIGGR